MQSVGIERGDMNAEDAEVKVEPWQLKGSGDCEREESV